MISGKNNTVLVSGDDLVSLIPQRAPMVLIDKLLYADDNKTITGFKFDSSCIFCENNFLTESGLIENIAQTAAAGVGYVCKKENKPVPIGFIAAIKNLEIIELPEVGVEVETEVTIINEVLEVTIVSGQVSGNGRIFANCEMRIFIKP